MPTWTVHDEGLTGATWGFDLDLGEDGRSVTLSRNTQFTDLSNVHVSDVAVRVVDAAGGTNVNTGATWAELARPVTLSWPDYGLAVNLSFLARTSGFWRRTTGIPTGQPQGVTTVGGAVNAFRFQIGENGKLRPVLGAQTDWLVEDQETPQPTDPALRYTTVEAVKLAMRTPTNREAATWQTGRYDPQIERIIRMAERQIDSFCQRTFDAAPAAGVERRIRRRAETSEFVDTSDFVGTPTVRVDNGNGGAPLQADRWYPTPTSHSGVFRGITLIAGSQSSSGTPFYLEDYSHTNWLGRVPRPADLLVTARWGWPRVPDAVAYAAELTAVRAFKRLAETSLGVLRFGEDGAVYVGGGLDAAVTEALAPYKVLTVI